MTFVHRRTSVPIGERQSRGTCWIVIAFEMNQYRHWLWRGGSETPNPSIFL